MDRNTLLAFVLSMGVFTLWLMWQAQNQPPPGSPPAASATQQRLEPPGVQAPVAEAPVAAPLVSEPIAVADSEGAAKPTLAADPGIEEWTRRFELGEYVVEVTNRGAALTSWTLTDADYEQWLDDGVRPMQLLKLGPQMAVFTTPFVELGLGDLGNALYRVESAGPEGVSFVFEKDGVRVRKKYEFDSAGYGFALAVEVSNGSDRNLRPRFEIFWPAVASSENDFDSQSLITLQNGDVERELVSAVGSVGFFGSLFGGRDEGPVEYLGEIDWAGVDIKYFVGAIAPDRPRSAQVRFEAIVEGKVGATVLGFAPLDLPPGQLLEHRLRGYLGPKQPELLAAHGDTLARSIDRGYEWLTPLTGFFQWLLTVFYSVIPNYGWAIILVTILVRGVTAPIMMRQMRSMERMRKVQPQLKELQEKHGDDRTKQSEEMMALYKREGVNPLGGCLPMLLQFPVFIGLFYALKSSIELRHAPFILWINDLSAPESLFTIPGVDLPMRVLPLVMGLSMVVQQRMQPMAMDPAQAKMMMTVMPVMMTVLFYQFPSGLVLYWMVSNFLGIGHQVWVGKRMKASEAGAAVAVSAAKSVTAKAGGDGDGSASEGKSGSKGKRGGKKGKKKKSGSGSDTKPVEGVHADG